MVLCVGVLLGQHVCSMPRPRVIVLRVGTVGSQSNGNRVLGVVTV